MVQHPLIGKTVGNHIVEKFIAEGGFGVVLKGRHTVLGSPVAIKALDQKIRLMKKRHRNSGRKQNELRCFLKTTDILFLLLTVALVRTFRISSCPLLPGI